MRMIVDKKTCYTTVLVITTLHLQRSG